MNQLDRALGRPRLRRTVSGWLIGSGISLVIIVSSAHGDLHRTAYGDGLLYRAVAARIAAAPSDVNTVVASRGTSLRYGRIGFPFLIWAGAGGSPMRMKWSQPIVMILVTGAASAATVLLFPGAGPLGAFLPFIAPGFALSVAGGYAEVLAAALCLWAIVAAIQRRPWITAGLLGWAILTKENAVFVLIGIVVWLLMRRRYRDTVITITSLFPVAGWYLYVAARYGHIPPLDPYLRTTTDTIGTPGLALVRSVTHPASTESLVMTLIHIGIGIAALLLVRRSLFGLLAGIASLQVLAAAPFAWRYIGDAARISTNMELLTLLALVCLVRPGWSDAHILGRTSPRPPLLSSLQG